MDIKTYTKTTKTYQYLDRNSAHPLATFKGFIKGETLRHARLCNNEGDFLEKVNNFKDKLLARNYSDEEINSAFESVCYANRKSFLTKEPKQPNIPLVFKIIFTPHLCTKNIKHALLKNWHLIENHHLLQTIFPNSPLIAYKRAPNIKDLLVKSKYRDSEKKNNDDTSEMDEMMLDALIKAL